MKNSFLEGSLANRINTRGTAFNPLRRNFRRENGCRTGSYDVNDKATFKGTTRERIFDGLVFFNFRIFMIFRKFPNFYVMIFADFCIPMNRRW